MDGVDLEKTEVCASIAVLVLCGSRPAGLRFRDGDGDVQVSAAPTCRVGDLCYSLGIQDGWSLYEATGAGGERLLCAAVKSDRGEEHRWEEDDGCQSTGNRRSAYRYSDFLHFTYRMDWTCQRSPEMTMTSSIGPPDVGT